MSESGGSSTRWENARILERPSGTWELLSDERPCARVDGETWYWCALRRVGHWRIYSGAMPAAPGSPVEELAPGRGAVQGGVVNG